MSDNRQPAKAKQSNKRKNAVIYPNNGISNIANKPKSSPKVEEPQSEIISKYPHFKISCPCKQNRPNFLVFKQNIIDQEIHNKSNKPDFGLFVYCCFSKVESFPNKLISLIDNVLNQETEPISEMFLSRDYNDKMMFMMKIGCWFVPEKEIYCTKFQFTKIPIKLNGCQFHFVLGETPCCKIDQDYIMSTPLYCLVARLCFKLFPYMNKIKIDPIIEMCGYSTNNGQLTFLGEGLINLFIEFDSEEDLFEMHGSITTNRVYEGSSFVFRPLVQIMKMIPSSETQIDNCKYDKFHNVHKMHVLNSNYDTMTKLLS